MNTPLPVASATVPQDQAGPSGSTVSPQLCPG